MIRSAADTRHFMKKTRPSELFRPYRITDGKGFKLKAINPADTNGFHSKEQAQALLEKGIGALSEMQEKLYAQDKWALLLIFQAMDAARTALLQER